MLLEENLWPDSRDQVLNLPEERVQALAVLVRPTASEPEELRRFSALHRLLRVIATVSAVAGSPGGA